MFHDQHDLVLPSMSEHTQKHSGKDCGDLKQLVCNNVGGIRSSNGQGDLRQGLIEHGAQPEGDCNAESDASGRAPSAELEEQPAYANALEHQQMPFSIVKGEPHIFLTCFMPSCDVTLSMQDVDSMKDRIETSPEATHGKMRLTSVSILSGLLPAQIHVLLYII